MQSSLFLEKKNIFFLLYISYLDERPTNAIAVASLPAGGELYLGADLLCMHITNSQEEIPPPPRKEILIKQRQLCSRNTL